MAIKCGVDIVEIDRIIDSFKACGDSFRNRVFTEREVEYCEQRKAAKYQSYAGRFAAKEAVSKALGTGMAQGVSWKDIEVSNDVAGSPNAVLKGTAQEMFRNMGGSSISLSISHCKNYAVAYVVIEVSE